MHASIERQIELRAPLARVWKALTDHREFGTWFGVEIEGPFVAGQISRGQMTYPGYEHLRWEARIERIEPERLFSFSWHPYAIEAGRDYSVEPSTLVEFRLQAIAGGTRLTVTESGFNQLPQARWLEALRMNERGWETQLQNVQRHVAA